MLLIERLDDLDLPDFDRPVHVAVGTFDGVHAAHAALLGRVAGEAHATGGQALVFTFQNHPRSIVSPGQCPPLISPWPLKKRLLARLPLDIVVGLRFDEQFANIPAHSFISDILVGRCRARTIHSGRNFHFGKGAYGGPGLLEEMAEDHGYRYEQLEPIKSGGHRISSTRIRECLVAGRVEDAATMLARPHQITAPVVSGDALGRTIGFPTANLAPDGETLLPADGVYAVMVFIGEETIARPGMMNIGWRPTVEGRDHRVEVHLIGFEAELVGKELTVQFIARLRAEQKFDGPAALAEQLERDRQVALAALESLKAQRV